MAAAAATKSGNSGIFWKSSGMFTYTDPVGVFVYSCIVDLCARCVSGKIKFHVP